MLLKIALEEQETKMQNAIAIRHVAFEDAGTLEGVLADRGIALSYLEAGVDDLAPAKDADLLLVLGGPIGIYEIDRYPFIKDELATIRGGGDRRHTGDRHLSRLPGARRGACGSRLPRQAEGAWLGRDDADEGGQSVAARRHRRRPRVELAW